MTGAIISRTNSLGLGLIRFNFPNWSDDVNKNMKIIDASFSLFGVTISGGWDNATAYVVGQIVVDTDTNAVYRCQVAHTSATMGTFAADRAAHPTYWTAYNDSVTFRGDWTDATQYYTNEVVTNGAYKYAITRQSFISDGSFDDDITDNNLELIFDGTSTVDDSETARDAAEGFSLAAQAHKTDAGNSATAAAASASAAATSQSAAATSATNSANSATASATSASNASTSATNASNSATAAATSDTNAGNSATAAATSATNANNSAVAAAASAASIGFTIADIPWISKAIGEVVYLPTDLAGVSEPPTGSSLYRYAKLTAGLTGSGQYNNGVLSGESTTGSAPLVVSTATVALSGSPINGQTISLLNTEGRYLKPGTSPGTVNNDHAQEHYHVSVYELDGVTLSFGSNGPYSVMSRSGTLYNGVQTSGMQAARTDTSTDVKRRQVTAYMRVK